MREHMETGARGVTEVRRNRTMTALQEWTFLKQTALTRFLLMPDLCLAGLPLILDRYVAFPGLVGCTWSRRRTLDQGYADMSAPLTRPILASWSLSLRVRPLLGSATSVGCSPDVPGRIPTRRRREFTPLGDQETAGGRLGPSAIFKNRLTGNPNRTRRQLTTIKQILFNKNYLLTKIIYIYR
ncbi:hypothetical protein AAG570_007210 [Ranatra chinensis]|uniref:Uncharacterized protein n=1 Tax=Ranatra chinensis TaxID=642074 RepID=A0ABD0XV90_9HEMI